MKKIYKLGEPNLQMRLPRQPRPFKLFNQISAYFPGPYFFRSRLAREDETISWQKSN